LWELAARPQTTQFSHGLAERRLRDNADAVGRSTSTATCAPL